MRHLVHPAQGNDRLTAAIDRLALLVALTVTLILPVGFSVLAYRNQVFHVDTLAQTKAAAITGLVTANPDTWTSEIPRILNVLAHYPAPMDNEAASAYGDNGMLLADVGTAPNQPRILRSHPIYDTGRVVGRVEVSRTMNGLIFGTLLATLLGVVLGGAAYGLFRAGPQRELRRMRAVLDAEQAALRANEERYRNIVEWSLEPSAVHRDGKIIYVNPAAIKVMGETSAQSLLGKSVLELVHPDSRETVVARLKQIALGEQQQLVTEVRFLRRDGSVIDVEVQSTSIIYDGEPATQASIHDVTERKRAEKVLAAAQRRSAVLAQLGRKLAEADTRKVAAVQILDTAQQLLGWDSAWLHLWDERQQKMVDLADFDLIDGEICEVSPNVVALHTPTPMVRRVMEDGPQLVLRDTESDAGVVGTIFGSGRRSLSLMFVPIQLAGRIIGILSIQSYHRHAYDQADIDLLQDLATQCAGALLRLQSADALRKSEERFQLANRAVFDVIWDQDLLNNAIWWGEHFEEVYGYRPDEAAQDADFWRSCIHPEDRDRVVASVKKAFDSNGDSWSQQYRFRRKSGAYAFVEDRALIIRDADGQRVRLLGAMQDVTERKRAERALQESEERYRSLAELSPEPIGVHREGKMLYVNPAAIKMFGATSAQELVGKPMLDLIHPDSRQLVLTRMKQFAGGDGTAPMAEMKFRKLDGTPIDIEINSTLIAYNGESAVYFVVRDITERKRVEGALRESENWFRSVWESSVDGLRICDSSGNIVSVNTAYCSMVKKTAQQLTGKSLAEVYAVGSREALLQLFRDNAAARSFSPYFEKEVALWTGDKRWFAVSSAILKSLVSTTFVLTIFRDITSRKQAELARASLEAQLRESQKMEAIGTLAGGIAHDFNNILATILGNTELARQDAGNTPQALESLNEIRKAGTRARDLVQQILSFSRRQPTERKQVALGPIIEESVRLLRATLQARITLKVHCDDDVPPVLADATQIQQVVINLSTNAMQAMHGGPGRIGIRLDTVMLNATLAATHPSLLAMHERHQGRTVRLAVSDNGRGMSAATVERIFEPFFTTKAVDEGTGLGLSVVHGIVQGHEGAMVVESEPDKGSTFTFYLPVADLVVAGGVVATPPVATGVAVTDGQAGAHILYLDDDESLVFLVQRLLERRGYRISGYVDQREALAALRARPASFDLVVTDYNMPGLSGLDVAREVRAIRADLPVAVASGFIDETLRAQAGGAGVRELIFKANAVEDLCEAFVRLVQTNSKKADGMKNG